MAKGFARASSSMGTKVLLKKPSGIRVGDLAIGDVIVDSEDWEFTNTAPFGTGTVVRTAPVEWVVAAQNHYSGGAAGSVDGGVPHTTLLSSSIVGRNAFYAAGDDDDSFGCWTNSDIRTLLNGAFYNHLSDHFKSFVLDTVVPVGQSGTVTCGHTTDKIFIPSLVEATVPGDSTVYQGTQGVDWDYFTDAASRLSETYAGDLIAGWWTRTARSPQCTARSVFEIRPDTGAWLLRSVDLTITAGVRSCLNVDADMLVTKV